MMDFFKRALTSITRRAGKSLILLALVVILGTIISGAISISQAVTNMEANLMRRLPPVVTINVAGRASDDSSPEHMLTPELMWEIGALPQVVSYDFVMMTRWITSRDLMAWENPEAGMEVRWVDPDLGIELELRGVQNPNLIDIDAGLIEITDGRHFIEEEMIQLGEIIPTVIAQGFADTNQLTVGATFTASNVIWPFGPGSFGGFDEDRSRGPFATQEYVFEVIGIFDWKVAPGDRADFDVNDWPDLWEESRHQNRIYIPNIAADRLGHFHSLKLQEAWAEVDEDHVVITDFQLWRDNLFILEDMRGYDAFREGVQQILPPEFEVLDLSAEFRTIIAAMDNMLFVARLILWIAIGATIVILSLLITLFLRDRKHEIGIYLALGERRSKVVLQILLEVLIVSLVGISLALLVGNMAADGISSTMLRADFLEREEEIYFGTYNPLEHLGYGVVMSAEEMLEFYQVSLDGSIIAIFYLVGASTVVLSAIIPIIYLTSVKPKKILM